MSDLQTSISIPNAKDHLLPDPGKIIDWDHVLLSAALRMKDSPVPMMLLIGPQRIMFPNALMRRLCPNFVGGIRSHRSILEMLPECAERLDRLSSDELSPFDQPILFSEAGESQTRWFQLSVAPVRSDNDLIVGIHCVAFEVTYFIERINERSESERRLREVLEESKLVGIWALDIETNLTTADATFARMLGLCPDSCRRGISDGALLESIHPDDRGSFLYARQSAFSGNDSLRCNFRVKGARGVPGRFTSSGKLIYSRSGEPTGLLGLVSTLSEETDTKRALQESRFQFETLTETLPQIVWSCDQDGRHDYFSNRWSEFTGIKPEEITNDTWKELVFPAHWDRVITVWEEARREGKPYDIDYRFRHHTGEYRWLRVMALPIRDENGCIARWFGTSTDVHESYLIAADRERLASELERIATEDQLTQSLTRRAFLSRVASILEYASNVQSFVGVLMLDVDHFKSINDTYGHLGGDRVLSVIAQRIRASINKHDPFGRLGGEEFVILLQDCTPEDARKVAERVRTVIAQTPIALDCGLDVSVTISLGVSARVPANAEVESMLSEADQALYMAKRGGRNRWVDIATGA